MSYLILGIESSCDDTSAAVIRDEYLLSNVMASQEVHRNYGGVIPELASRAHQQNILPVVDQALKNAGVTMDEIDAIAFTRGPGLLGSLLVGTSFAKGLSISTGKPLVEVNHLQGHILSHFLKEEGKENRSPEFPFLSLLVSGGHTQIVKVTDYLNFEGVSPMRQRLPLLNISKMFTARSISPISREYSNQRITHRTPTKLFVRHFLSLLQPV